MRITFNTDESCYSVLYYIQFTRKNCTLTDNTYPRRFVFDDATLESGKPKNVGGPTPIKVGDRWGKAPSRWTVPVLLIGNGNSERLAKAEIVFETVFPAEIRAMKMTIESASGLLSGEYFTAKYIDDLGEYWGDQLVQPGPNLDRVPGGTVASAERQLRDIELLRVAIAYASGGKRGYKAVSDVLGIPRQTAALRIQSAREAGFLPPVDTPVESVWDFAVEQCASWFKGNRPEE